MKFVIWLTVAGAIVYLVHRWKRPVLPSSIQKPPAPSEAMAQCSHCGVYLPASESIAGPAAERFCSEEHLHLHAGTPQ